MRAWRRAGGRPTTAIVAAALLLLAVVAAGCGGDDDDEAAPAEQATETEAAEGDGEPIRIGHLSTCEGPFAVFYDATTAGAMLPLIQRGAEAAGARGNEGVTGAEIAGRPVEIVWGCSDATPDKAADEARRLVEEENVDILIGPLSGSEGIAVANYAKEQQGVTFLNGSSAAQDTTLKVQAPNFFRWGGDGAQWMAGLGAYAYNDLGWRTAVIIGDDYDFPYTQAAGFVAEFCSLGGEVVQRLWPPLGEEDYSSYIAQLEDADGFVLNVTGTGTLAFVRQYEELRGNLAERIVASTVSVDPNVLKELGNRVVGVATAGPVAADSDDPKFQEYLADMKEAYPDLAAGSLFDVLYYDAMEATILALEEVDGDLSDDHAGFREALQNLELDAPNGDTTLDEYRNSVAPNYVFRIVADTTGDGVPDVETLKEIPDVDQTFGGFFDPETPTPDRENPECREATPPPWATD
jgi:branched-chain amino acid transport system substrate-binding protein